MEPQHLLSHNIWFALPAQPMIVRQRCRTASECPRLPCRKVVLTSRVALRCLANSSPDDIARPPTWRETLRGACFWANWRHWDQVPTSKLLTLAFVALKLVGTVGGYQGRAHFARQSGLKPLLRRREDAAAAVSATAQAHLDLFPTVAARVAGSTDASQEGPSAKICLAVVIPAFARAETDKAEFRRTLEALGRQTRRPDAVIVVDDASPADLEPQLDAWPEEDSIAYVRMVQNTGPAGARSVGMRLLRLWAKERRLVVCMTDSDALPHISWCEAMLNAQSMFPGVMTGPTLSSVSTPVGRFHDHFGSLNGRWTWQDPPGTLIYGCTCNFSIDMTAVGDLEFDPIFSRPGFEDIEFCWRARKDKKVLTRYCEGALMYHEYDRGFRGLYNQFWKYGNTEPIMAWMHSDFSFQGSRPVTLGFKDPRLQALRNSIPADAGVAASELLAKFGRLFEAPPTIPPTER